MSEPISKTRVVITNAYVAAFTLAFWGLFGLGWAMIPLTIGFLLWTIAVAL